jgi:hypothetical protein
MFRRRRRIGSSYAANCSEELKQKPAKRWLKENAHINTEIVIGIDWTETHRIPSVERAYYPRMVRFPLCEAPLLDKADMLTLARERGLEPPRLYKMGLPARQLRRVLRPRRAGSVRHPPARAPGPLRLPRGAGGTDPPATSAKTSRSCPTARRHDHAADPARFREQLQNRRVRARAELFDRNDIGGCGCFVDEPWHSWWRRIVGDPRGMTP